LYRAGRPETPLARRSPAAIVTRPGGIDLEVVFEKPQIGSYSRRMSFLTLAIAIVIAGLIVRHFGVVLEVVGIVTVFLVLLIFLST